MLTISLEVYLVELQKPRGKEVYCRKKIPFTRDECVGSDEKEVDCGLKKFADG